MTEEEKKLPLIQWDDDSLGKMVKAASLVLYEKNDPKTMPGIGNLNVTACGVTLIAEAIANNSEETTIVLRGATKKGEPLGDWKIVITPIEENDV